MLGGLALAVVWTVATWAVGQHPARRGSGAIWALIAAGIPILGLVTLGFGPVWGLVALAGGAALLRRAILRVVPEPVEARADHPAE